VLKSTLPKTHRRPVNVNLRIPGPIPVPDDILEAMAEPMINHRGPEFKEILYRVTEGLKQVFETENEVWLLTSSGTGAMEAAIVNTLSPGDKVICATAGSFGDRFGEIAGIFGAEVVTLEFPWGTVVDPDELRRSLRENGDAKAVLVTHNETSTGVTMDLEAVAAVVKGEFDKLLLVDGISSVCSLPLRTDAWGCDVVTTASQKGWMLPPGLAFISFSDKAWEAHASATMPRYYFDLSAYKSYYEIGQPPYTPALSVIFALDVALAQVLGEGMGSIFERHRDLGRMTREGLKKLGLKLFPDEKVASDTVTAVTVPDGVDAAGLLTAMRTEHGVVLAGGQDALSGKIFRIGHMGRCTAEDIQDVLDALERVLPQVGFKG
jgi:aspartate aminotransferase-like enzyme